MTAAARKIIVAKSLKKAATPTTVAPFKFPKRSDFAFDFPRRADFGIEPFAFPKFELPKLGNSKGVQKSWNNAAVRIARTTKNGVMVVFEGVSFEYKSVADAFRQLRLPFERHIKFRLALKAAKQLDFSPAEGKVYKFAIVENDCVEGFRIEG